MELGFDYSMDEIQQLGLKLVWKSLFHQLGSIKGLNKKKTQVTKCIEA